MFYRTVKWDDSFGISMEQFFDYAQKNIDEYEFSDCGGILNCIGGKVCGDFEDGKCCKAYLFG